MLEAIPNFRGTFMWINIFGIFFRKGGEVSLYPKDFVWVYQKVTQKFLGGGLDLFKQQNFINLFSFGSATPPLSPLF